MVRMVYLRSDDLPLWDRCRDRWGHQRRAAERLAGVPDLIRRFLAAFAACCGIEVEREGETR